MQQRGLGLRLDRGLGKRAGVLHLSSLGAELLDRGAVLHLSSLGAELLDPVGVMNLSSLGAEFLDRDGLADTVIATCAHM